MKRKNIKRLQGFFLQKTKKKYDEKEILERMRSVHVLVCDVTVSELSL